MSLSLLPLWLITIFKDIWTQHVAYTHFLHVKSAKYLSLWFGSKSKQYTTYPSLVLIYPDILGPICNSWKFQTYFMGLKPYLLNSILVKNNQLYYFWIIHMGLENTSNMNICKAYPAGKQSNCTKHKSVVELFKRL